MKGIIVENIERNINEEIEILEEEKTGLTFMLGTIEEWDDFSRTQYLKQILDIEEKIDELRKQKHE